MNEQTQSQIVYVKRNGQDVEVLVRVRIQKIDGQERLVFSVEGMSGKPIELTLDEYEVAADALYSYLCETGQV